MTKIYLIMRIFIIHISPILNGSNMFGYFCKLCTLIIVYVSNVFYIINKLNVIQKGILLIFIRVSSIIYFRMVLIKVLAFTLQEDKENHKLNQ